MRPPRISPMIMSVIQTGLSAMDGARFTSCSFCPFCGGSVTGYDTKQRLFAVLAEDGKERDVTVTVRRFACSSCGKIVNADEPFYPATRIGSPVVDLCCTLSATLPATRAATVLEHMGVIVDRGSVRNYRRLLQRPVPATELFGYLIPVSVVRLSTLAGSLREGSSIEGAEALAACGFPCADRAAFHLPPGQEGDEWDKQEQKEERQTGNPAQDRDRE